jgi:hypothetical protein
VLYERANTALAEAIAVDEILHIRDQARMLEACARVAENRDMEANALALRLRATRKLGKVIKAQKETVGLSVGTRGSRIKGARVDDKPTLASQGIKKATAHQARVLAAMDDPAFERKVAEARRSAGRVFPRAVREAEIARERVERRAQTAQGGSVADLHALIRSGFRAGTIGIDPPWPFTYYSERASRAATDHYETMTLDEIKALPIRALAADDCALFMWATWPNMPIWIMAPVGAHSEKPDEAYRRMQRLYGGPYLELFARKKREGWTTWGDEIPRERFGEAAE